MTRRNTIVILQPSYLPWRGYFDLIRRSDTFIFYDDVQYDRGGWRNRNQIKTPSGLKWLTIPVHSKGHISEGVLLRDVAIDARTPWRRKHLDSIRHAYARAPHFKATHAFLENILEIDTPLLADLTIATTTEIARHIGLQTQFMRSSQFGLGGNKTQRLVDLLKELGADRYLSGASAKSYIDESMFAQAGIELEYATYDYPVYHQFHGPFTQHVSIVDALMMLGPQGIFQS
jgi:WbqC-like protein family